VPTVYLDNFDHAVRGLSGHRAFAGILTIAVTALILDAALRGLLLLADPSRRG
jgi:hypothetical protein